MSDKQLQDVERFFSDFSEKWSTLYGGKRSAFWRWFDAKFRRDIYERYALTFAALGEDLTGKTILDVGCGNGEYVFEAARRGATKVLGIDVAEGMISLCRTRARELGFVDRTDFECVGFPPPAPLVPHEGKYDFAIVMGVMDYVPNPVPFLRALSAHVSDFAVISFPGRQWLRWQVRRWRYRMLGRCPVFHYRGHEVRKACAEAGIPEMSVEYLPHSGGCWFVKAGMQSPCPCQP